MGGSTLMDTFCEEDEFFYINPDFSFVSLSSYYIYELRITLSFGKISQISFVFTAVATLY